MDSKYTHYIFGDEIVYPFLNFNGFTLYWACDYLTILGLKLNHIIVKGTNGIRSASHPGCRPQIFQRLKMKLRNKDHFVEYSIPLRWRHNGRDSVSNHQPHRLFRRRSKKTSKLRVTGLCVPGEFPAQMASNAENVSIWWRHHDECDSRVQKLSNWWITCRRDLVTKLFIASPLWRDNLFTLQISCEADVMINDQYKIWANWTERNDEDAVYVV